MVYSCSWPAYQEEKGMLVRVYNIPNLNILTLFLFKKKK